MNIDVVTPRIQAILSAAADLYDEVADALTDEKIASIANRWLAKATMEVDDEIYERAMDLAADLEAFAPSSLGTSTAFDRLARRRALTTDETAALVMIRDARMVAFHIVEVVDGGFAATDLVGGTRLTVLDPGISPEALDVRAFGRLGVLPDGRCCVIGLITPLDDAGLAVAVASLAKTKSGAGDHRCATAVFKHVARHGNPKVAGLNWYPDDEGDSDPLDLAASLWSEQKLPDAMRAQLETDATVDSVVESLFRAHGGSRTGSGAYVAIADLQLRALEQRFDAGGGRPRRPIDEIREAIAWEVEQHDYPADAQASFLVLRDKLSADRSSEPAPEANLSPRDI